MASIPTVPKLTVPSLSVPKLYVPKLSVPRMDLPGIANQTIPHVPRQHVKNVGDILLGDPFSGTTTLQHTLEDAGLEELKYIPIINRVAGVLVGIDENFLDPLFKGEMGKLGINLVESFSQSMDTLAQPIKSLMPWAGGGTYEDFLSSLGLTYGYRKQYNWDTGSWIVDFLGELVSDPVNWISWGGKQVTKSATDTVVDSFRKNLEKKFGKELVDQVDDDGLKMLMKASKKDLLSDDSLVMDALQERFQNISDLKASELKSLKKGTTEYKALQEVVEKNAQVASVSARESILDAIQQTRLSDGFRKYTLGRQLSNLAHTVDKSLLYMSMGVNPGVAIGYFGAQAAKSAFVTLYHQMLRFKKEIDLNQNLNNRAKNINRVNKFVLNNGRSLYKEQFNKWEPIMKKYGLTPEKLVELYEDILYSVPDTMRSSEYVRELFMERLFSEVPELRRLLRGGRFSDALAHTRLYKETVAYVDELLETGEHPLSKQVARSTKEIAGAKLKDLAARDVVELVDAISDIADIRYIQKVATQQQLLKETLLQENSILSALVHDMKTKYALPEELTDWYQVRYDVKIDYLVNTLLPKYTTAKIQDVDDVYNIIDNLFRRGRYKEAVMLNAVITDIGLTRKNFKEVIALREKLIVNFAFANQMHDELINGRLPKAKDITQVRKEYARQIREFKSEGYKVKQNLEKVLREGRKELLAKSNVVRLTKQQIKQGNKLMKEMFSYITQSIDANQKEQTEFMTNFFVQNARSTSKNVVNEINTLADTIRTNRGVLKQQRDTLTMILNELNPKDLKRANISKLRNSEEIQRFLTYVDLFDNYAGQDKPLSELFKSVINFDFRTYQPEDLVTFKANYDELSTRVQSITSRFRKGELHFVASNAGEQQKAMNVLLDLKEYYFLDKRNREIMDNVSQLIETQQNYFHLIVSAQGRHTLIMQSIQANIGDEFYLALSNPESKERVALRNFAARLSSGDEVQREAARHLQELFDTIDSNVALMYSMDQIKQILPDQVPKELKDYLVGEFFNRVYEIRSNYAYGDLADAIIEQQKKIFMDNFDSQCYGQIKAFFEEHKDKYIEQLADRLGTNVSSDVFINELLEIQELERIVNSPDAVHLTNYNALSQRYENLVAKYKELFEDLSEEEIEAIKDKTSSMTSNLVSTTAGIETPIATFITELRDEVKEKFEYIFDNYITMIRDLERRSSIGRKTGIKIFTEFDSNIVSNLTYLGDTFEDLMDILLKDPSVTIQTQQDTAMILLRLSGRPVKVQRDAMQNFLKSLWFRDETGVFDYDRTTETISNLSELLDTEAKKYAENSLGRAITQGFQNIDEYITNLTASEKVGKMWKSGYKQNIRNVALYMSKDDINAYIRETSHWSNIYAWSTANGMLVMKKGIDAGLIGDFGLIPTSFKGSPAEYLFTYNLIKKYSEMVSNKLIVPHYDLTPIRQALAEVFSYQSVAWGPVDAHTYFNTLGDHEILIWDLVARDTYHSKSTANAYNKLRKAKLASYKPPKVAKEYTPASINKMLNWMNPYETVHEVRTILNTEGYIPESVWEKAIVNADNASVGTVINGLEEDLGRFFTSPDAMQYHKGTFTKYIRENQEALNNARTLLVIGENDKTIAKELGNKYTPEVRQYLESMNIRGNYTMNSGAVRREMKHARSKAVADNVKNYTPKAMRAHLDSNTAGYHVMMYVSDDPTWTGWKYTQEDLDKYGLKIMKYKDTNIWLVRTTDVRNVPEVMHNRYKVPKYVFQEQQNLVTKLFKKSRDYINWHGNNMPDELWTGDMIDRDFIEAILDSAEGQEFFGDSVGSQVKKSAEELFDSGIITEKQKTYSNWRDLSHIDKYEKSIATPDFIVIGDVDAKRQVYEAFSDVFQRVNYTPVFPSELLDKSAVWGVSQAVKKVDSIQKWCHTIFRDDLLIDSPLFNKVFEKATDKDFQKIFKRNNWTAVILREDSKGRPKVYKVFVNNRKQYELAKELGAVVLPHEMYRQAVLAINKHSIESKILKVYNTLIVATYKSIYLTTPGFLFRNGIDSMIYKNANSTEGIMSILENFKYEYEALKMLDMYDKVIADAIKLSGSQTYNKKYLLEVLSKMSEQEQLEFRLVDVYMRSAASSGMTKSLQDFLLQYNVEEAITNFDKWLEFYDEHILNNPLARMTNNINDHIEQSARFGLFLNLVHNGTTTSDAISKVISTHFDYEMRSDLARMAENIFWFSTFPINNLAYYINEGLENNIDLLKAQLDAMQLSYGSHGMTWDEVRESDYLTYNALTGNLRFEFNGKGYILKTGSSVLDFFQILYNPLGSMKDRLNPVLSVLLGLEDISELNPFNANISRAKQIIEGRSYVPSIYSTLYPKRTYNKKRKTTYTPNKTWYTSAKRAPKKAGYNNAKRARFRATTYRYYYGHGPHKYKRWLLSTTSTEPVWFSYNHLGKPRRRL